MGRHRIRTGCLFAAAASAAALGATVVGPAAGRESAAGPPVVPAVPAPPVPVAGLAPAPAVTTAGRAAAAQEAGGLVGTFALTAGTCSSGSFFRMIQPGGGASGPFVLNSDSPCSDKTYTPLAPGSDGGLVTGSYQPGPDPPFDVTGGGAAARITSPQKFYGVNFATATNPSDPQTGQRATAPRIDHDGGGRLTGDLRAFAASWNNQHFNQGSPKPDGSRPGNTAGPSGTYDAASGAFVLQWTSQIVGGPFNNFTGLWHFEGTFRSSTSTNAPVPGPAPVAAAGTPAPAPGAAPQRVPVGGAPAAPAPAAAPLARTGPAFPSGYGFLLFGAGLAGLVLARRVRRPSPSTATGVAPHG